jgi:hypothetical protein
MTGSMHEVFLVLMYVVAPAISGFGICAWLSLRSPRGTFALGCLAISCALLALFSGARAHAQVPTCDRVAALESYASALDQLAALEAQLELLQCPSGTTPPPPPPPTGWPSAASTGPDPAVTLVNCAAGNITSSKSGCIFPGPIVIAANNVTIRDSIINGENVSYGISSGGVVRTGTVLERVEVFNANSKCIYIQGGFTASKLDLHDCEDGAFGDGVTITDSWFHDLRVGYPRHPDGFQVPSVGNVVLKGNNFDFVNGAAMNSGIFIQSNFGQVNSALVEGNRFKGGGYHIYVDNKGYACPINVKIRGNTFVRGSYGFGIASIPCAGQTGWEWSGNKYDDGAAVPQP